MIGGTDPDAPPKALKRSIAHYCFDERAIMRELLTIVSQLTSSFQGLVEVRFPETQSSQLTLDFSQLTGYVKRLMTDVKYFMDMLRPHISDKIMKRFEKEGEGSFYWLQKNLMEDLLQGHPNRSSRAPADALVTNGKPRRARTVEWISQSLSKTYNRLLEPNRFGLSWVQQRDMEAEIRCWWGIKTNANRIMNNAQSAGVVQADYFQGGAVPIAGEIVAYQRALGRAIATAVGNLDGNDQGPKNFIMYHDMRVPCLAATELAAAGGVTNTQNVEAIVGNMSKNPLIYGSAAVNIVAQLGGAAGQVTTAIAESAARCMLGAGLGPLTDVFIRQNLPANFSPEIADAEPYNLTPGQMSLGTTQITKVAVGVAANVAGSIDSIRCFKRGGFYGWRNLMRDDALEIPAVGERQPVVAPTAAMALAGGAAAGWEPLVIRQELIARFSTQGVYDLYQRSIAATVVGDGQIGLIANAANIQTITALSAGGINAANVAATAAGVVVAAAAINNIGIRQGGAAARGGGLAAAYTTAGGGANYPYIDPMNAVAIFNGNAGPGGMRDRYAAQVAANTSLPGQNVQPEGVQRLQSSRFMEHPSIPRVALDQPQPSIPYAAAATDVRNVLEAPNNYGLRYYNTINGDRGMSDYFTQYGSLFAEMLFYNAAANGALTVNFPQEVVVPVAGSNQVDSAAVALGGGIEEILGGTASVYRVFGIGSDDSPIAQQLISTARPSLPGNVPYYPRPQYGAAAVLRLATGSTPNGRAAQVSRRLTDWGRSEGLSLDRSMVFKFNQILAMYLGQFYDVASGKIYRNLVEGFANGTFSRAVMSKGHTLPDLSANVLDWGPAAGLAAAFLAGGGAYDAVANQQPGGAAGIVAGAPTNSVFGVRGDPTGNGVLQESLGLVLQRMVNDVSPTTQVSDHLVSTLSEIPLYVRESYRANLPVYIKLFELVQKEGELLKNVIQRTQIGLGRPISPFIAGRQVLANAGAPVWPGADSLIGTRENHAKLVQTAAAAMAGAAAPLYECPTPSNERNLSRGSLSNSIHDINLCSSDMATAQKNFIDVINSTTAACYSMGNAAVEVLRELADEPLYLQTHENSIEEYKARNNTLPLMPLSIALTYMRDIDPNNPSDFTRMLPDKSVGTSDFKMLYGSRKLFGRPTSKFTLADAPGIRKNLEDYNSRTTESPRSTTAGTNSSLPTRSPCCVT